MHTRSWLPLAALLGVALVLAACGGEASTAAGTQGSRASSHQLVSPDQLHDMLASEDVFLVNVHVPYEGEIPGTDAFIPYTEIASRMDELPFGEQQVVIYCRSGNMSSEAADAMVAAGAPSFAELSGGFFAWQDAGYPLTMSTGSRG
jgi:rhodanese-related sulfurtransferase